ncbi:MAG: MarR family transcriptional regulator [Clostridiales bacterium]|nr:MarR family transcriptional regulator [Clostridiales bacterium]
MFKLMGKYIATLYRQEQKYINDAMKEYQLGFSSYKFLFHISRHEGISQKELCKILNIDEALATRTMKKMENQKIAYRKKSENDSHSYALYLTDYGQEILPKLTDSIERWWDDVMIDMTKEEAEMALKFVEKMYDKARTLGE